MQTRLRAADLEIDTSIPEAHLLAAVIDRAIKDYLGGAFYAARPVAVRIDAGEFLFGGGLDEYLDLMGIGDDVKDSVQQKILAHVKGGLTSRVRFRRGHGD